MWTTVTPPTPTSTRTQSTTCATCMSEHISAPFIVRSLCWSRVTPHWTLAQVVLESFTVISMPSMMSVSPWFSSTSLSTSTCTSPSFSFSPPWPADRRLRPGLRAKWPAPLRQGEPRRLRRHPLPHTSSTRGISMPNFEVLDARISSPLNKIIHNSQLKKRISLEE